MSMKSAALVLSMVGRALAFPADCPNVTTLHSVTRGGWYDGCLGLKYHTAVATAAACKDQCYKDMNCSVWQMTKVADKEKCWSGSVVHACLSRGNDNTLEKFEETLLDGERIQHGFIKIVAENAKMETIGLRHYPEKTGTDAEKTERCRGACDTDVTCTVWQYGADGCWMEHAPFNLKGETKTDSDWAKGMTAGQTIEHTCPPYKPESLPWAWIITGIVLGLLALGAILYVLQKKPKVKKTRAVKIEPKAEPMPVYFIPQPTMLIPQTSVVSVPQYQPVQTMQAQPMMMQQPMQTMQSQPLMMQQF